MMRIHLDYRFNHDNQCYIYNVNGDFLGILAKVSNGYVFNSQDWIINVETKEGETIKSSLFFENQIIEYCFEKINMLVEKYINRFFEKEE